MLDEIYLPTTKSRSILVTGCTGYVGGRLVTRLIEQGHSVRCLVRNASRIKGRDWNSIDSFIGDALDFDTLRPAMEGVEVAYYLIHAMGEGERGFDQRDRMASINFGRAAQAAGVKRIVYLGGLVSRSDRLSPHLGSRIETGDRLRDSGVPVTEFRAGVIVGSGSLSFELIRYLTERVPIIIGPRGIDTLAQPIGIRDVLRYLIDCLELADTEGRIIEIGGRDVLSYREMLLTYARIRGLRRRVVVVPFVNTRFLSLWANLVTPMPGAIIRPVFDSIVHESVCRDDTAHQLFGFEPRGYEDSIKLALARIEAKTVETVWSDAQSTVMENYAPVELTDTEGMIKERRQTIAHASASNVFKVICRIGGSNGWPYANYLWQLRGFLDRLSGGVGLRYPRRNPEKLRTGDVIDYWRVEAIEQDRLLRLRSEMKLPGRAWLQFEVEPVDGGSVLITQTAFYEPKGLFGHLYWLAMYPPHRLLFRGFIQSLARRAEQLEQGQ